MRNLRLMISIRTSWDKERKALGRNLVDKILCVVDYDLKHAVFSFIPNTAEVAFIGMIEGLEKYLDVSKATLSSS